MKTAVLTQLGITDLNEDAMTTLNDIVDHGISGGFNGFIWYTDTVKFAVDNIEAIKDQLKEDAQEFGDESIAELVSSFNCLGGNYSQDEIAEAIYTEDEDATDIMNALAWYAAETVARDIVDANEE